MNKYYSIVPVIALSDSKVTNSLDSEKNTKIKKSISYIQEIPTIKWRDFKAHIQRRWTQLTDEDLLKIKADSSLLKAIIRQRYAKLKSMNEIDTQLREFLAEVKES